MGVTSIHLFVVSAGDLVAVLNSGGVRNKKVKSLTSLVAHDCRSLSRFL